MRILQIAQFYPPVIGGEENHVRNLAVALVGRGHEVMVATQAVDGVPAEASDEGVRVHRVRGAIQRIGSLYANRGRRLAPPIPDPGFARGLRGLLDQFKPDLVHGHNWAIYSYLPLHRRARGLVLTLHDYSSVCAKKTLIRGDADLCEGPALSRCPACAIDHYGIGKGILTASGLFLSDRAVTHAVNRYLAVSSAVAVGNQLSQRGLPFEVIPNFIPDALLADHDPATEAAAETYTRELPDEPFILYVGAFARRKGVQVLLDAYRLLVNPPPLVLIGYDTSETLSDLSSPAPGVLVRRNWPHHAVMAAWKRALVGVVPSIWADPSPTVAMEAMAASKPLVVARLGGLIDLVTDGETGIVTNPGDPHDLARALSTLAGNPELVARMGAAARVKAPEYAASSIVARIEGVYRDIAARTSVEETL